MPMTAFGLAVLLRKYFDVNPDRRSSFLISILFETPWLIVKYSNFEMCSAQNIHHV
jgi:hypothetical protein